MVVCRAMTQNVLDGRAFFVRGQRGALMIGGAFAFRDGEVAALSSLCDAVSPIQPGGHTWGAMLSGACLEREPTRTRRGSQARER